ncbi:MAG: asparagine synthase (glutamine-hydrolyzing) [Nitrospina sp.]|jgi:asparagine synthase (glutamine-hydrolysing)|nr:asparagine synthase (glutamine-hydrolyzing) [Nitrospina sp.]
MCGIAGIFGQTTTPSLPGMAETMVASLVHRGPDDNGVWVDEDANIALGHRRLSILDLSLEGHQPMLSADGRYVMVFNGEIYNHSELRVDLEKESESLESKAWRGHSDTETLLACFSQWGIEKTLERSVGMFAIALWDKLDRKLYLARDRFGEKPLYYGWVGNAFAFGSELKALRKCEGFSNSVDRNVLALYMRYCYVPAPYSIYQNIFKLEPGCLLTISIGATKQPPSSVPKAPTLNKDFTLERWWSLDSLISSGVQHQITDEREAIGMLESRLAEAIRLQSIADVPLGAFLSGGIDSSSIVALMQKHSSRPVKTFTIGFEEEGFNEATYAKAVAKHLGTEHIELYIASSDGLNIIPNLPQLYDEPFADSSQIPTHMVCRQARSEMKVALSGDAGDELFGGYNRYFWAKRIWNKLSWLPQPLRSKLAETILLIAPGNWDTIAELVNNFLPARKRISLLGDKAHKLASRLRNVRDLDDLYLSLISEWSDPASVVIGAQEPSTLLDDRSMKAGRSDHEHRMMYWDSLTYLPDDILCKVDRAAMGVGLETRVPFLDHRVAELAWQLPLNMKIRNGQGKWVLRQVLDKYVPKALIDRPKAGFGVPVGQWIRGPLNEWAEVLLDENRLRQEGYFNPAPISKKWAEHKAGTHNWTPSLWATLMFQAWLESQNS